MGIYAALGVPEVWRLDNRILFFQVLQGDGSYAEADSQVFPAFKAAEVPPFLALRDRMDENAVIRQFANG